MDSQYNLLIILLHYLSDETSEKVLPPNTLMPQSDSTCRWSTCHLGETPPHLCTEEVAAKRSLCCQKWTLVQNKDNTYGWFYAIKRVLRKRSPNTRGVSEIYWKKCRCIYILHEYTLYPQQQWELGNHDGPCDSFQWSGACCWCGGVSSRERHLLCCTLETVAETCWAMLFL